MGYGGYLTYLLSPPDPPSRVSEVNGLGLVCDFDALQVGEFRCLLGVLLRGGTLVSPVVSVRIFLSFIVSHNPKVF